MKLFVLMLLLLTGCANTQIVHVPICPSLVHYSKQSQERLAGELKAMPTDSETIRYILDYKRERDMLGACHQQKKTN